MDTLNMLYLQVCEYLKTNLTQTVTDQELVSKIHADCEIYMCNLEKESKIFKNNIIKTFKEYSNDYQESYIQSINLDELLSNINKYIETGIQNYFSLNTFDKFNLTDTTETDVTQNIIDDEDVNAVTSMTYDEIRNEYGLECKVKIDGIINKQTDVFDTKNSQCRSNGDNLDLLTDDTPFMPFTDYFTKPIDFKFTDTEDSNASSTDTADEIPFIPKDVITINIPRTTDDQLKTQTTNTVDKILLDDVKIKLNPQLKIESVTTSNSRANSQRAAIKSLINKKETTHRNSVQDAIKKKSTCRKIKGSVLDMIKQDLTKTYHDPNVPKVIKLASGFTLTPIYTTRDNINKVNKSNSVKQKNK